MKASFRPYSTGLTDSSRVAALNVNSVPPHLPHRGTQLNMESHFMAKEVMTSEPWSVTMRCHPHDRQLTLLGW